MIIGTRHFRFPCHMNRIPSDKANVGTIVCVQRALNQFVCFQSGRNWPVAAALCVFFVSLVGFISGFSFVSTRFSLFGQLFVFATRFDPKNVQFFRRLQ